MVGRDQDGSYVQCLECGQVHRMKTKLSVEVFTTKIKCPYCNFNKGINCGDNIEDIYLYISENIDPRYYTY